MIGEELAGYRLRGVLGRGGMSVVYQAENARLGSIVAIKVLAPELAADDVFRTRFLQESRIAASLNHPNVIPIFDAGPCGHLLYIAMRYVSGADLRTVLKAHEMLAPDQSLLIISQAGRALDAAHRMGLVHRDVKPGNFLVERGVDEEPDHVYLADFGITKHAISRSGLTATGQFVGTIDYIAPEQIQGKTVDARTDIYSLGCVLYECLTGRVPFQKDVDAAVIWAHVEEQPMAPSDVRPELPKAIDSVIFRALAKDPDDRFSTCRELVADARTALKRTLPSRSANVSGSADGPNTVLTGDSTPPPPPHVPALDTVPASGFPTRQRTPAPSPVDGTALRSRPEGRGEAVVTQPPSGDSPPRSPRGGRALRRLVPGGVIVLAIAAGIVIWASSRGASSTAPRHPHVSPAARPGVLLQALNAVNSSASTHGQLKSCIAQSAVMVTCSLPDGPAGGSTASFRRFSSLGALYNAYKAEVTSLERRATLHQNYGECDNSTQQGEVSWNHHFQHSKRYTLAQVASGGLTSDSQAAGRVYCTLAGNDLFRLVWTDNPNRLLASVEGGPHPVVYTWWHAIHHAICIACLSPGAPSMSTSSTMSK